MRNRKITFGNRLFEASIVAFGVIFGLFLTDWNAQRKTNQNVEKTLEYIIVELENNIALLKEASGYHATISKEIDSLNNLLAKNASSKLLLENRDFDLSKIPSWRGIGAAKPEFIIYESAQISGVFQELNISSIRTVANAYEGLKTYEKVSESTLNLLINLDSNSKINDLLKIFDIIKQDVRGYELFLIEDLQSKIKEIRELKDSDNYKK